MAQKGKKGKWQRCELKEWKKWLESCSWNARGRAQTQHTYVVRTLCNQKNNRCNREQCNRAKCNNIQTDAKTSSWYLNDYLIDDFYGLVLFDWMFSPRWDETAAAAAACCWWWWWFAGFVWQICSVRHIKSACILFFNTFSAGFDRRIFVEKWLKMNK